VLAKMLDESGVPEPVRDPFAVALPCRSSLRHSRRWAGIPRVVFAGRIRYGMFGGNSNWRGPIWMPVNALIIRALMQYYLYFGNDFTVECPTGSGRQMNLYQVAEEISRRLTASF